MNAAPLIEHELRVGETGSPLTLLVDDSGDPVNIADYTAKVYGETAAGGSWIAETTTGITANPTQNFTASASENRLTANGHKLREGQQIVLAGDSLPGGLAAATRYFVRNVTPNDFQVSLRPNSSIVDVSSAGSGTMTFYVVGTVRYQFQSGDVDEAGSFRLEIRLYDGSSRPKFTRTVRVPVVAMGAF